MTYTPIATTTVSSATTTITFSSIPNTYTDLVLVVGTANGTGDDSFLLRMNADSGTNYSNTTLDGSGTSATSRRRTGLTYLVLQENGGSNNAILKTNILNYANTSTFKTTVGTGTQGSGGLSAHAGLWRSTSAINSVTLFIASSLTFATGTVATIYGITAA